MARKPNTLNSLFRAVEQLSERMQEDPYYDREIRRFFKESIPRQYMRSEEVEKYFQDKLVMTEMITTKLRGWLNGFLNDDLKNNSPNELLNENIYRPEYNPPLPVKLLKELYQLNQSERTIYNWINKDRLLPSSNSGTRLYYRVEFEHLLRNKGVDFDKDYVRKKIPNVTATMKKINKEEE